MKKTLPKHCSYAPCRKKGPYIYFIKDGIRVTMPGRFPFDQNDGAFWAKYAECLKGTATQNIGRRTFGELTKKYRASEAFTDLRADTTQITYGRYLTRLNDMASTVLVRQFKRPDLIALRDKFKDKPTTANAILMVAKVVLDEGVNLGWIEHNPAAGVKPVKVKTEQRLPWTETDVERIYEIAHPRERLAIELCINTGQRIADVLNIRWDQLKRSNKTGGKLGIFIAQEKTNKQLFVPFTERLCRALDDADRHGEYILSNKLTGEKLAYTGIEQAITKLRKKLGIKKTIHDLRHTAAHRLAAATKGEIDLIASITGHTNSAMVRRYANETLQIEQANRAVEALNQYH